MSAIPSLSVAYDEALEQLRIYARRMREQASEMDLMLSTQDGRTDLASVQSQMRATAANMMRTARELTLTAEAIDKRKRGKRWGIRA